MNKAKEFNFIPKKAMVIFAHPDDAEIGMAGTIKKFTSQGHDVKMLTAIIPNEVNSGESDLDFKQRRLKESINAASELSLSILNVKNNISIDESSHCFMEKGITINDNPELQVISSF